MKNNAQFSIAMSQETGALVMLRTNGHKVTVVGALTRDQTLGLADSIQQWMPDAEMPKTPETAVGEVPSRPVYPH